MYKNNPLIAQPKEEIINILQTLTAEIEQGTIRSYEISQSSSGSITIKADSSDGAARFIQIQTEMPGYTESITQKIKKQSPDVRRDTVQKLTKQGLTQTEIAERTLYSQKTISNDIRKLKESGRL